ncbi:MAG TPA: DUF4424 domain-containing protein [Allosphingosinicella sp.]|nr:DUF4424 domain-containing protein [Allosphingosinicella sp.]
MRHPLLIALFALAGLTAEAAVRANDSAAEQAVGGLVLTKSDDIDMVSEDLYVSAREVRVRYVFRNRSPADVRTIVAFPLPDRDLAVPVESDTSWPADFATTVDGRPVRMQVEHRALLGGVDHSALLRELNVPIAAENIAVAAEEALERLDRAQQDRLAALRLIEAVEGESDGRRYLSPRWTVKETWHWEQVFPAGRDLVVEHRYTPAVGGTVATGLTHPEFRAGEGMREMAARYCIDSAFLAAVDRAAARTGEERPTFDEQWIGYILTTGANWRAPIGEFRLVVDKGDPGNLVSFCGEGVQRISPTRFEMRRRNWRPDRDLDILILRPWRPE